MNRKRASISLMIPVMVASGWSAAAARAQNQYATPNDYTQVPTQGLTGGSAALPPAAQAPYPPGVPVPARPAWQNLTPTGAPVVPGTQDLQNMQSMQAMPPSWSSRQPNNMPPAYPRPYGTPPASAMPMPSGPGFAAGYMPPQQALQQSAQEQRVARLEQTTFGSTYPEHELDDRLEHLEREMLGSTFTGDPESRLARMEHKNTGGAFAAAPTAESQAPIVPAVAQAQPFIRKSAADQPAIKPRLQQPPPPAVHQAAGDSERAMSDFQTAVQSIPVDEKAGDYFANIQRYQGGTCARWTSFPIRVHIPMNTPEGWKAELENGIRKWSQALPMMMVSPREPADIEIAWINRLQPRQLGITNLEIFNGRPRVTIYLLRPSAYAKDVSESLLVTVATHEIGHGLGLWAHSPNSGDVMQNLEGMKQTPANPSARDINTLKRVYECAPLPDGYQSPEPVGWSFTHYAPLRK